MVSSHDWDLVGAAQQRTTWPDDDHSRRCHRRLPSAGCLRGSVSRGLNVSRPGLPLPRIYSVLGPLVLPAFWPFAYPPLSLPHHTPTQTPQPRRQQCRRAGCALRQPALSQCPQHPRCLVPTRAFSGWPQISRLRLTTCLPGAVSSSPERQGKAQALRGTAITSPSSFNCSRCALLFVLTAQVFPPYFLLNCWT